jgi:uncharacterized protein YsxB (DUF464 family)
VKVSLDVNGCLSGFSSLGHSQGKEQGNIVCAAISALVRTASRVICIDTNIPIQGDIVEKGSLQFKILAVPENKIQWLKGITDFLIQGLNDIHSEYPHDICIEIKSEKQCI